MTIQPRITTTTTITTISEIGNNDVLCGRSKECFNNIGNRRFRVLINLNLNRYLACKKQSFDRSTMIHTLTEEICESIRFFKRTKKGDGATSTTLSVLIELSRDQCREKISHALRDAASQQIKIKNKNKSKGKTTVMIKAPISKKRQATPFLPQRMSITNINNEDQKIQDNNSTNPPIITNTCPLSRRRLSMYVFQEEIQDYEVEQVVLNSDCMSLPRMSDIFNNSQGERNDDENINNSNNNNNHQHHSNRPQLLYKEKRTSCNYGFTFVFDDDDDGNININSNIQQQLSPPI